LPFGTALRCWYNDVGKWYTRSDNTTEYDGYQVFDFKISHPIKEHWTVSLDVKNLFDEDYSEYVSNWSGSNQYAGSPGRYFQITLKYSI
jgi:outer membrane receptor protein involved in Fe transport